MWLFSYLFNAVILCGPQQSGNDVHRPPDLTPEWPAARSPLPQAAPAEAPQLQRRGGRSTPAHTHTALLCIQWPTNYIQYRLVREKHYKINKMVITIQLQLQQQHIVCCTFGWDATSVLRTIAVLQKQGSASLFWRIFISWASSVLAGSCSGSVAMRTLRSPSCILVHYSPPLLRHLSAHDFFGVYNLFVNINTFTRAEQLIQISLKSQYWLCNIQIAGAAHFEPGKMCTFLTPLEMM